jgi:hypothetical protein
VGANGITCLVCTAGWTRATNHAGACTGGRLAGSSDARSRLADFLFSCITTFLACEKEKNYNQNIHVENKQIFIPDLQFFCQAVGPDPSHF